MSAIYVTRAEAVREAKATLGRAALSDVHFTVAGDDQAGYQYRPIDAATGEVVSSAAAHEAAGKKALKAEKPKTVPKSPKASKAAPVAAEEAKPCTEGMSSAARHTWLEAAAVWCGEALAKAGHPVPAGARVSFGLSPRAARKTLGFCFHSTASSEGIREVFIGPHITDPVEMVGVVMHELTHAALPDGEAHGRTFSKVVRELGLVGKPTATTVGPELKEVIETQFLATHPYCAGHIDLGIGFKKQTTRLIKVACPHCGYTARTTRKWIEAAGAPICPIHTDEPMEVEGE